MILLGTDGELRFASPEAFELLGCHDESDLLRRLELVRPMLGGVGSTDRGDAEAERAEVRTDQATIGAPASAPGSRSDRIPEARTLHAWTSHLTAEFIQLDALQGGGEIVLVGDGRTSGVLEASLRLASRFLAVTRPQRYIAHELRDPLNAMVLNLHLLRATLAEEAGGEPAAGRSAPGTLRGRQIRYLDVLRRQLTRLNRKMQILLLRSEPGAEEERALDLRHLMEGTARYLGPLLRARRVRLERKVPRRPVMVVARRADLRTVLTTLALAAVEAMPDGGSLAFALTVEEREAVLRIGEDGRRTEPFEAIDPLELASGGSSADTGAGAGARTGAGGGAGTDAGAAIERAIGILSAESVLAGHGGRLRLATGGEAAEVRHSTHSPLV